MLYRYKTLKDTSLKYILPSTIPVWSLMKRIFSRKSLSKLEALLLQIFFSFISDILVCLSSWRPFHSLLCVEGWCVHTMDRGNNVESIVCTLREHYNLWKVSSIWFHSFCRFQCQHYSFLLLYLLTTIQNIHISPNLYQCVFVV